MSAEVPIKRVEIPRFKEQRLSVSPETAVAAARVATQPDREATKTLITAVGKDLKAEGIAIGKEDYKAVMKQAEAAYVKQKTGVSVPEIPKNGESGPAINIDEYRQVMGELFDTYDLGKGNWQTVTGIYGGLDLVSNVLAGFQTKPWVSTESREALMDKVDRGLELLRVRQTPIHDLGGTLRSLDAKTKKQAVGLLLSAGWPWIAGVTNWFVGKRVEKVVDRMFGRERSKLQRAVNNRIADSLFMREFEFLHDKPAGEIMEIIDKGQFATVHLVAVTYKDFLPTLLSVISQLPRQYVTGKLEFFSSILKLPFLWNRSEKTARFLRSNRAQELAAMDKVNTKLMTTLSGLESARTAGSAEAGADSVFDALIERDYLEAHGLGQKMASHRKMNILFDVMDVGVPVLHELWQFMRNRPHTSGTVSGEGAYNRGLDILSRIVNSKNQQMEMRSAFSWLTSMYVDQIIPDIQDIKRMEELLGKYDALDRPDGPKEQARLPVFKLPNTDIRVENVSYKGILRNVSLDIPQGSFVTIKGESGTGKTTLTRTLMGLYTPQGGSVRIGGVTIDGVKKYGPEALTSILGYANQNPQILEGMTLRENLLLWSQKKIPDAVMKQTLTDLRLEHLLDRLDTTAKHFSGGELKRIGIARALLKNPKILILDEPTASLDSVSSQQVMNIIAELRKKRPDTTVVAITHDPIFEKISERIIDFEKLNKPNGNGKFQSSPQTLTDHQVLEAIARPMKS